MSGPEPFRPFSMRAHAPEDSLRDEARSCLISHLSRWFLTRPSGTEPYQILEYEYGQPGPGDHALSRAAVTTGRREFGHVDRWEDIPALPFELLFDVCEFIALGGEAPSHEVEAAVNYAMVLHREPWRMLGGRIVKTDSESLARLAGAALAEAERQGAAGAHRWLKEALVELDTGTADGALTKARKAAESALKWFLGEENGRTLKPLLADLRKWTEGNRDVCPPYFRRYLDGLEEFVHFVGAAGGHQGTHSEALPADCPPELARIVVSTTVALVHYLIDVKARTGGNR